MHRLKGWLGKFTEEKNPLRVRKYPEAHVSQRNGAENS